MGGILCKGSRTPSRESIAQSCSKNQQQGLQHSIHQEKCALLTLTVIASNSSKQKSRRTDPDQTMLPATQSPKVFYRNPNMEPHQNEPNPQYAIPDQPPLLSYQNLN
jgi:hypothetical protein